MKLRLSQKCYFIIDSVGFHFPYKGDEVTYLWRKNRAAWNLPWLSTGFESTFRTLKEIDQEWDYYFASLRPEKYSKNI
jgi:hypothetical protein